jgi:hypothetical protein
MTKHNAKKFFNSVCTFLQDHGYLDADWYAKKPKAVNQFMKELNDYEVADLIDTKERNCENCYYDWLF